MYARLLVIALVTLLFHHAAGAVPRDPEKIDVFRAGEGGYGIYRIPGMIVTGKGSVLAYCEARKGPGGDWSQIDVLLRRSTDGGRTWDAPRHVAHLGEHVPKNPIALVKSPKLADVGQTVNNPVAIVDHKGGAIHFLYCVEYARCFYMRSDDDGVTFSKPVEITATFERFRPDYEWKVIATGPAHGIRLKGGRLVVPVWMSTGTGGGAHRPSVTSTVYSDDEGKTWHRGDIAVPNTPEWVFPNETVVVELADGRVMLNVRSESAARRRLVTISPDGATGWSTPRFDSALLEPICMASITRLSRMPEADRNRILFANPHNLERRSDGKAVGGKGAAERKNLSIKLSYDEGQTWPVNKPLEPGPSEYSDMAVLPDGTALCLYNRTIQDGEKPRSVMTLARFTLEWLTDGKDSLSAAPSASAPAVLYPPDPVRFEADKSYRVAVRNQALAAPRDVPGLPRVLLIGDSISIGYTLPVRVRLNGKVNVHRVDRNAGGTRFAMKQLKGWLGDGKWDVIHFNFGLHDLAGNRVPAEEYEKSLRKMVAELKATGAKVIWASTTPRPPGQGARDEGLIKFNEIAERVMKENGVAIDDLYAAVLPRQSELQRPNDAHYTLKGYEFLGDVVAASIEAQLPGRSRAAAAK
jgi:hypothetical protein